MRTTVPVVPVDQFSALLFENLGSFWSRIYTDRDFIRDKCRGDGLMAAQTYLNLLEAAACLSHVSAPAFHRECWFPLVIRESEADTGADVKLYVGMQPAAVIGGQPDDTAYTPGQEFTIGGSAIKRGFISYPVRSEDFDSGMVTASSSIIAPAATYLLNVDYYVVRNSMVFKSAMDPFSRPDKFPIRDIVNESGVADREIILWGSDVLMDRNYTRDYFGYMQKAYSDRPAYYADMITGIFDLKTSGTSMAVLGKSLAKCFGVSAVQAASETVTGFYTAPSGDSYVLTDTGAYRCGAAETVRPDLKIGSVLQEGEFLTESLKLYSSLNPDSFLQATGRTLEQFVADVPKLPISLGLVWLPGILAGFSVEWKDTPLIFNGYDANGHAKLSFALNGVSEVETAYWTAVWAQAEAQDVDMAVLLEDFITGDMSASSTIVGTINPMRFFMKNCLNSNTSVLVVDFDAIPEYITGSGAIIADITSILPSHTVMLTVVKRTADEPVYDLETVLEGSDPSKLPAALVRTVSSGILSRDTTRYGAVGTTTEEWMTYSDFKPIIKRAPKW